jgi:hypothetical protein
MANFYENNKMPITIIAAALIIAAAILFSRKPPSAPLPPDNEIKQIPRQTLSPSSQSPSPASTRISFYQAPDNIGKVVCVTGKVDHVYTSGKGTVFINFCADYKNCPFGAVIFVSNAPKFPNPQQYTGKNVEITGFITAYQGRPEIILESPDQIKID